MAMTMTKEEILKELKSIVQELRTDADKLRSESFRIGWKERQRVIGVELNKLNSCDSNWLNDEYGEWFNSEIRPHMPEIDPSVSDEQLEWK